MSISDKLLKSAAAGGLTPSENFNTVLYTGNSSTQVITGVGFQPDFVWIKERDDGAENHNLIDSSRGTNKIITTNLTNAEFTSTRFTSFDTDGFTLANNNETNDSGVKYVAWCWKAGGGTTATNGDGSFDVTVQANIDAGFSIITYTGQGSDATYGHGLDSAPDFLFTKTRSHTSDWPVYHKDLTSAAYRIVFNSINAENTDNNPWNSTAPTDSVISIKGDAGNVNTSGRTYVTYAFHSISGFSKFGSYVGNGNANGPVVETGFEVGWLMMKNRDDTEGGGASWNIYDNKRNTSNPRDTRLWANANSAEYSTACYDVDFLANGFQIAAFCSTYAMNEDGDTYLYIAFAADPDTTAPTLADSFGIKLYTGDGGTNAISSLGFSPSLIWLKDRDTAVSNTVFDIIRGAGTANQLFTDDTDAQGASSTLTNLVSFDNDGFTLGATSGFNVSNNSGDDYVAWCWKANDDLPTINEEGTVDSIVSVNDNAGFSIVQFTTPASPGSSTRVGHGLSAAPDCIIMKRTDGTEDWYVYHTSMGTTKFMRLNTTAAMATATNMFNTVNATVFNPSWTLTGNQKAIAYCFHSVAGYSKFGSYTGDGLADKAITVGFQPDWILIKSTVGSDNWRLYDTTRGITAGGFLEPNNSDADNTTNAPGLTITSTGWEITSGGVSIGDNVSGNLYTYYAFKIN